jgi:hypothetical protein
MPTEVDTGAIIGFVSLAFALLIVLQQNRAMKRQTDAQIEMNQEQVRAQIEIAKMQFRSEVLSQNRQEWINSLRDELADFISYLTPLTEMPIGAIEDDPDGYSELIENKRQIDRCAAKIELLLNPSEPDCSRIADMVNEIRSLVMDICEEGSDKKVDKQLARLDSLFSDLVPIAQAVLKTEWTRVKSGE